MHINYILNLGNSRKSYVGSGSFEMTGSASVKSIYSYQGSGSFELVGSATSNLILSYASSGGFELFGSAIIPNPEYSYVGSGSFELVGTASTNIIISYTSSGGFELFGSSPNPHIANKIVGSGGFELVGTGSIFIPTKTFGNVKFSINQTGTTYENTKYTILQVQGTGSNPLYLVGNTISQKIVGNDQIFTDSEIVGILSNKYKNDTIIYENTINNINEKLSHAPFPVDDYQITNLKFLIRERFINFINEQKEIISINGSANQPNYHYENGDANNFNALTVSENAQYRVSYYDELIDYYENKINHIDNRLSHVIPTTNTQNYVNSKFFINENGINQINQTVFIISIFGNDKFKYFDSEEKVYKENQLLDDSEAPSYLSNEYDIMIVEYNKKIQNIDNRLDDLTPMMLTYTEKYNIIPIDYENNLANVKEKTEKFNKTIDYSNNMIKIINDKLANISLLSEDDMQANVKFTIKQDGHNELNQMVTVNAVTGDIVNKYFDSNEGIYKENQLLDDSEASSYFIQKYNNKIDEYTKKLEEINRRIINA